MLFPAARQGDTATHDMTAPSGVIGPPVSGPCPKGTVLIEGLPAAHISCVVACSGASGGGVIHPPLPSPPNPIVMGSRTVLIHNKPAARTAASGDLTLCTAQLGNLAQASYRSVLIGGPAVTLLPNPTTDDETMMQAMFRIRTSQFAQTPYGQRVVDRLNGLQCDGRLNHGNLPSHVNGTWSNSDHDITINDSHNRQVDETATILVHEGTHAVEYDDYGYSRSIDEEVHCFENQLDFYEEQRNQGYMNGDNELLRTERSNGTLRNEIQNRYSGLPQNR